MKKLVLAVFLLIAGVSGAFAQEVSAAQSNAGRENALKLYPFAFIKSRFAVSYERALQKNWSLQLGGGVVSNDQSSFYNARNVFGYSADLQFRKYLEPGKENLAGIYVAPHLGFKYLELKEQYYNPLPGQARPDDDFHSTMMQGGLVMGYQLPILEVVVADVFAGGGYRHTNPSLPVSNGNYYYDYDRTREFTSSGVYPILGLQIGVMF